jgi:hypothetical protein
MDQNIIFPNILNPQILQTLQTLQTPQINVINNVFIIQNIPPTPIKPKLGPLNDVQAEDDKSVQNLNHIFTMIENID